MTAQTAVQTARRRVKKLRRTAERRHSYETRREKQYGSETRRQSGKGGRAGDRLTLQLAVCGGAFVLLVAAKVLVPAQAAALRQSLGGTMERNLDVQEVFSAVGRAVGGEENGAEEVWQAVFSPLTPDRGIPDAPAAGMDAGTAGTDTADTDTVAGTDAAGTGVGSDGTEITDADTAGTEIPDGIAYTVKPGQGGMALNVLQQYRAGDTEAKQPSDTQSGTQPNSQPSPQPRYSGKPLPDNVSMEQCILNFAYCTPVSGTLTSGFGWRTDPIQGGERFHHGADLASPDGTDILCFADGTVTAVGESTSYGKYCIIDHAGGYSTLYAHCSRVTAVSGSAVSLGEKIAEVGSTGAATGPHLHFELHRGNLYLNPIYYVDHG